MDPWWREWPCTGRANRATMDPWRRPHGRRAGGAAGRRVAPAGRRRALRAGRRAAGAGRRRPAAARTRSRASGRCRPSSGVSRGSVSRAYDRLREDGYLLSARGAGSWLTLPAGAGPAPRRRSCPRRRELDLSIAALPAPDPLLADAAARAAAALPRHLPGLGYTAAGLPELREAIAARLTERGLPTAPDEVLVTAGAQHALQLVLDLLVGPGRPRARRRARLPADAGGDPRRRGPARSRSRSATRGWDAAAWAARRARRGAAPGGDRPGLPATRPG